MAEAGRAGGYHRRDPSRFSAEVEIVLSRGHFAGHPPLMQTVHEILSALESVADEYPEEALEAAVAQKESITPELVKVLEAVAENPAGYAEDPDYHLHVFAAFLLAQFREKAAYRPLLKMLLQPGGIPFDLLGSQASEGLHRILASVFDGDPEPLQRLVECEEVDEYARVTGLEALMTLGRCAALPREMLLEYLRSLFHGKIRRNPSFLWSRLVEAVTILEMPELIQEVRQAFKDELPVPPGLTFEEFLQEISEPTVRSYDRYHLVENVLDEIDLWTLALISGDDFEDLALEEDGQMDEELEEAEEPGEPGSYEVVVPYIRPAPKIGRNDPCPCGSGKKYKKCCGKS